VGCAYTAANPSGLALTTNQTRTSRPTHPPPRNTCPYGHPGEKARRRSPRNSYQAVCCPDIRRRGRCPRGESCPYAHSVFEIHLHPAKFRTKLCRDGAACTRQICFFAHAESELRTPSPEDLGPLFDLKKQQQVDGPAAAAAAAADSGACAAASGVQQSPDSAHRPHLPSAAAHGPQQQQQPDKYADAKERVWQHLLSLQEQQERADIVRAVQEAAAETGFMLLPSTPLPGLASTFAQLSSSLLSMQTTTAGAIDAVCDAPAQWPMMLPCGQRAPGAAAVAALNGRRLPALAFAAAAPLTCGPAALLLLAGQAALLPGLGRLSTVSSSLPARITTDVCPPLQGDWPVVGGPLGCSVAGSDLTGAHHGFAATW